MFYLRHGYLDSTPIKSADGKCAHGVDVGKCPWCFRCCEHGVSGTLWGVYACKICSPCKHDGQLDDADVLCPVCAQAADTPCH